MTRAWLPLSLFFVAFLLGQLTHHPLFDFIGNPMIFEFLFGVLIAKAPKNERFAPLLLIIGLIGFGASPLSLFEGSVATAAATSVYRAAFWGVPAALVVYSFLCLENRWRWPAFGVFVGNASYSIYLFHMDAVRFLHVHWLLELASAIALGLSAHLLIERPIMGARKRLSKRQAPDLGAVSFPEPVPMVQSPPIAGPGNQQAF